MKIWSNMKVLDILIIMSIINKKSRYLNKCFVRLRLKYLSYWFSSVSLGFDSKVYKEL